MKVPHPIPYQGSKRHLASSILPFFPREIQTLFEPFSGSAAISIAAAVHGKSSRFHLNDVNKPLMALWNEIISHPSKISTDYENLWLAQHGKERQYYDMVRDHFNKTKRPDYLLYLLARCVKASVRYNATGDFNQSPDNRRLGRHPQQMKDDIVAVSSFLQNKTILTSADYKEVLAVATSKDLVYLDPPYQGVCTTRDRRYVSRIDIDEFMQELTQLNDKGVPFILSYDGRTGKKLHGQNLPDEFGMYRFEIEAGRSAQATLLGRNEVTYESIYLSRNLVEKLPVAPAMVISNGIGHQVD